MPRKKATPDQQAAAKARRDQFRAIAKKIGAMPEAERAALAASMAAVVTVEGRALSVHNACLVAAQRPTATLVGGFRQWIAAGRVVRKGEHGLMIWAPCAPKADPNRQPGELSSADGDRPGFIPVTVFDVAQTDELTAGVTP